MQSVPTSPEPSTRAALPTWARALDFAAVALVFAALVVGSTGGNYSEPFGIRISARSPERILAVAVLLICVRHWRVRHPSLSERFAGLLQRAPAWTGINAPLAVDEAHLFARGRDARRGRLREMAFVSVFYAVVVCAATYPQLVRLDSVPDLGDPLFSTWRLAWVAHQLPRDPIHLFDGNIFHPERLTLTYSDATLVPALITAPFLWLGAHPLYAYNVILLLALMLSGVTMFVLVRALTGRVEAGLVAGTIFALYPYRFEHYSHLELQFTFWMPLLLLAVHRVLMRGGRGDGVRLGLLVALQTLSSLYYGTFLLVYLTPIVLVLALQSNVRQKAVSSGAVGIMAAAVLVAPVAASYIANRSFVGERDAASVRLYSALPRDYLNPHARSSYHGLWDSGPHQPERELFPTVSPVLLSVIGMWPPLSAARIGYVAALVVSFEASRGTNGALYRGLRSYVPPFRGLRVPARFSVMVGLTLAVLAGYGAARLVRSTRRSVRTIVTAALVGIALWELTPRLDLVAAWVEPPPIYESLVGRDDVVLAEFPMPDPLRPDDARATYFSVFHWHKLVNGISGHYPTSYIRLLARQRTFPDDTSIAALRDHGVTHVVVHGAFYPSRQFQRVIRTLDRRPDVALLNAAAFEGSESRLYRLTR